MEDEARSLILYILDADRRHVPASDILAAVAQRLSAIAAAQREQDAQALRAYKERVQEDGALWWPVSALDDLIAALAPP